MSAIIIAAAVGGSLLIALLLVWYEWALWAETRPPPWWQSPDSEWARRARRLRARRDAHPRWWQRRASR